MLLEFVKIIIYLLDIEELAIRGKEYAEMGGRNEVNIMDMLFSLLDRDITKQNILDYIKQTKIRFRFAKQGYLEKIFDSEEREREALIKKINLNNTIQTSAIPDSIVNAIPQPLRLFPRDFALKETEIKLELNEDNKKVKTMMKNLEKKSLEDIISSNTYYDLSKKRDRRKNSIDINYLYNDVVKTENINLGKKFRTMNKLDKEFTQLRKEEIFPLAGNDLLLDKYNAEELNEKNMEDNHI
jgi:hypothetical protein